MPVSTWILGTQWWYCIWGYRTAFGTYQTVYVTIKIELSIGSRIAILCCRTLHVIWMWICLLQRLQCDFCLRNCVCFCFSAQSTSKRSTDLWKSVESQGLEHPLFHPLIHQSNSGLAMWSWQNSIPWNWPFSVPSPMSVILALEFRRCPCFSKWNFLHPIL